MRARKLGVHSTVVCVFFPLIDTLINTEVDDFFGFNRNSTFLIIEILVAMYGTSRASDMLVSL